MPDFFFGGGALLKKDYINYKKMFCCEKQSVSIWVYPGGTRTTQELFCNDFMHQFTMRIEDIKVCFLHYSAPIGQSCIQCIKFDTLYESGARKSDKYDDNTAKKEFLIL